MHSVLCVRTHSSNTCLSALHICLFVILWGDTRLGKSRIKINYVISANGIFCYLLLKGNSSTLELFRETLIIKICKLFLQTKISTLLHLSVVSIHSVKYCPNYVHYLDARNLSVLRIDHIFDLLRLYVIEPQNMHKLLSIL